MTDTTDNVYESTSIKTPYRPRLSLFHPNGRGTGCAVNFELHPAHDNTEGSIMLTAASQMTIANRTGATPTFPHFDWENKVTVKLGFSDLCKILQVLRGETESIDDGKGIFHSSATAKTKIAFRHVLEPVSAYSLEIYRTRNTGSESRMHFLFNSAEALGLCEAITGSMSVISFGIPMVIPRKVLSNVGR